MTTTRPEANEPRFREDFTPNAKHDDENQKKLRAFARKLEAMMYAEDIGGALILASKHASSWLIAMPRWSGLTKQGPHFRLRLKSATPEDRANGNSTSGMIGSVRDLAGELHLVFKSLFDQVDKKLRAQGSWIDHPPIGSEGHIGPLNPKAKDDDDHNPMTFNPETDVTALELRCNGLQIDPAIPDAAWVSRFCVRPHEDVRGIDVDAIKPEDIEKLRVQIWEPFRWLDASIVGKSDEDPPWIPVKIDDSTRAARVRAGAASGTDVGAGVGAMIKAAAKTQDGRDLIIIGLSDGNIAKLQDQRPILLNLKELGLDGLMLIMWGPTEDDIQKELTESGLPELADVDPSVIPDPSVLTDYKSSRNRKLKEDDAGVLGVGLSVHPDGFVVMNFGTTLNWIGMTPDEARALGAAMIAKADAIPAG